MIRVVDERTKAEYLIDQDTFRLLILEGAQSFEAISESVIESAKDGLRIPVSVETVGQMEEFLRQFVERAQRRLDISRSAYDLLDALDLEGQDD